MSGAELIALGAVIGANNLAAALALGALGERRRGARIVAAFGLSSFLVPLVGLLIGQSLAADLSETGRWISAALLALLGLATLRAAGHSAREDERLLHAVTSWRGLVALSLGLSLDNLFVGFALGLEDAGTLLVAAVIAVFAIAFTMIGLRAGERGHRRRETLAEAGAGLALLAVAAAVAAGLLG